MDAPAGDFQKSVADLPRSGAPQNLKFARAGGTRAPRSDLIDLTGRRFDHLVITGYAGNSYWNCICDCGRHTVADGPILRKASA